MVLFKISQLLLILIGKVSFSLKKKKKKSDFYTYLVLSVEVGKPEVFDIFEIPTFTLVKVSLAAQLLKTG